MVEDWEYLVRSREDCCAGCGVSLGAGAEVVAALLLTPKGFVREDRCPGCFNAAESALFSFWRIRRPEAFKRGPQRLDLAFLTEFFKRLEGRQDDYSRNVAWIVALLLLRKRILALDGRRTDKGREVLVLRLKREDRVIEVTDPLLTEDVVKGLHEDLARIFNIEEAPAAQAGEEQPGG